MRRWITVIAILMLVPAGARAALEKGVNYSVVPLPQPVTGRRIEVREFFWYGCPHCFVLEPVLERWLKSMPRNAVFKRTPGTAPPWMVHAQTYYAFRALGVENQLTDALFDAIHEQHRMLNDETSIAQFVGEHGVSPQHFTQVYHSFGVRLSLDRAIQLNKAYQIDSVPTFVVDGKYLTSPTMAGGEKPLFRVLDELIVKAARERHRSDRPAPAARR